MPRLFSKLVFVFSFYLVCSNISSSRFLEEKEEETIDECIEFITDITPVRLENLEKPIDYEKDNVFRLGYYEPRNKYEFVVCKENDLNDCQLRYSDNESYTVLASDRDYKKVTERNELHGRSIYRTHSFIFKYKSVKLKLDEGLIKGENGEPDSCKEGYRICGKFHKNQFPPYTILCFPWEYDCPFKNIKGAVGKLSQFTEQKEMEKSQILNFARYTEEDFIQGIFAGFMYYPMYQKENLNKMPFSFTNNTASRYESVFGSSGTIDIRELFKENNIYSHYLDFYLKDMKIDSNMTYRLSLSAKFMNIWNFEKKCYLKKEQREEYLFDNYDDDCLTMIEHIYPTKVNDTEKIYEKDAFKLADYIPENEYEHVLCKTTNKSDCEYRYTNDSTYQRMYYDKDYDLMNTTYIGNTAKPVYIWQQHAFKYDKLNIRFKETFDSDLYKCKDGYRACARIKHHPWATLLCVPNMNYCPFNNIIGDMYDADLKDEFPYNFGYWGIESFHYSRYKMNDSIDNVTIGLYLRHGIHDNFDDTFPFSLGTWVKGLKNIVAKKNYVYNMEKIFTENGIPINFVKYYYSADNYQTSKADGRMTRMYLNAEVQFYKNLKLTCEESSSNNEIILYGIWTDKNKNQGNDQTDVKNDNTEKEDSNENKENKPIEIEEAIKKSEVSLTFRRLSGFKYTSGTISFLLYALTTKEIAKGNKINLSINLFKASGEMEENSKNISCTLESDVKPENVDPVQAEYKCVLTGLKEEYISIRLNNSESVVGIPKDDEISLNPVLSDKSLEKEEKSINDEIPASFIFKSIDQSKCKENGVFTIIGELTKEVSIANKFSIPLTYPSGVSITCSLIDSNLECSLDKDIKDKIVLEQTIIKEGIVELLNIKNFSSPEVLDCQSGILKEAEKKSELSLSFRQVSHLVDNKKNGFSFFFAGLTKKTMKKGESFIMKLLILLNGIKTEKEAKCALQQDASLQSEEQIQADFNCDVTLEKDEYKNLNLSNPSAVTIPPDNEEVSGCSELNKEESSPKATDDAIEESKNENSELAKVVDYSLSENKNKIPPRLEIKDIINLDKCSSEGTFKLKGSFDSTIEEEMTFTLPLSYPKSNIKCSTEKAEENKETEIECKVQKEFTNVKSFIFESRVIKKKRKEILFITNKKIKFSQGYSCENFNNIKLQKTKTQKSSSYSFIQMSRPQGMDSSMIFFMALMKKDSQTTFSDIKINIDVIAQESSLLRFLQETSNLDVNCKVQDSSSTACSMGCTPTQKINGNAAKVVINDNTIGGVPDIINVETDPSIDYSIKTNLEKLDSLPSIKITDFNGDECDTSGKFTIEGDITGTLSNANNIIIQLSNPDSSGLCALNVANKKATINCENAEDFDISTIMIAPQIVNDESGINPLFKITNDFTSPNQYSCTISYQWSPPQYNSSLTSSSPSSSPDTSSPPDTSSSPVASSSSDSTPENKYYSRKSSSDGLSGGAIAGISIGSIVVVAAIIVPIVLWKKGIICAKNKVFDKVDNTITSTINNIAN